ncbi:MAG: hypothetical protein H6734_19925 [Alphaproteobacteria bacterium]|nr:hypothetical protein [Alphaproteobacteria bacterium]
MVRNSLALLFLGLAGIAFAQDSGIESALQKAATATPQEMRDFATSSVSTVSENAKAVGRLTDTARTKGDFRVQNCLTPKNTSAQALVQVTELSAGNLNRALDEGGEDGTARARHEYRKIAVSLSKSDKIRSEAEACNDGDGDGTKSNQVTVSGGTGEDGEDNDTNELDSIDIFIDPPVVSVIEP